MDFFITRALRSQSILFQKSFEPISIIPLSNNEWNIFKESIENHEKAYPRAIP